MYVCVWGGGRGGGLREGEERVFVRVRKWCVSMCVCVCVCVLERVRAEGVCVSAEWCAVCVVCVSQCHVVMAVLGCLQHK